MMSNMEIIGIVRRRNAFTSSNPEEIMELILNQITNPVYSDTNNHLKELKDALNGDHERLDDYCGRMFAAMMQTWPELTIDVSEYDNHYYWLAKALYKLLARNFRINMKRFILGWLLNDRNRNDVIKPFLSSSQGNYPIDAFGCRENFILMNRFPDVLNAMFDDENYDGIDFEDMLKTLHDDGHDQSVLMDAMTMDIIADRGTPGRMYRYYESTGMLRRDHSEFMIELNERIVQPYLRINGHDISHNIRPVIRVEDEEE